MPDRPRVSRRIFLRTVLAGSGGAAALTLAACSKKASAFACLDTTKLSAEDSMGRINAGYVDQSSDPARACGACVQFEGTPDGCGSCKVVRGPVNPRGTCRVFAPKS